MSEEVCWNEHARAGMQGETTLQDCCQQVCLGLHEVMNSQQTAKPSLHSTVDATMKSTRKIDASSSCRNSSESKEGGGCRPVGGWTARDNPNSCRSRTC